MATDGGLFGAEEIDWFNGGLFDSADVLPLTGTEIGTLLEVGRLNWALIEPAIFGTLFERGLDPDQRAQLGAHYTDRDAIWAPRRAGHPAPAPPRVRGDAGAASPQLAPVRPEGDEGDAARPRTRTPSSRPSSIACAASACSTPPAAPATSCSSRCGRSRTSSSRRSSGARSSCERPMQIPQIGPEAVLGIEINAYAAELARVTIWIGEIQWMLRHGLGYRRDPILQPLDHIETRDALLDLSDPTNPREAEWPEAEFIVGNPPFLGGKLLRRGLGDDYVETLFDVFDGRVPREADLVHLLAREGASADRRPAGRGAPACWPRRASAAARTGASWSGSRRPATSSSLGQTSRGSRRARTSTSASSARTTGPSGTRARRRARSPTINADLTSGVDLTQARRLAREPRASPSWATRRAARSTSTPRPRADCSPRRTRTAGRTRRRPAVGQRRRHHRPAARHVDHRLRRRTCPSARPRSTRRRSSTFASTSGPTRVDRPTPAYAERWWLHVRAATRDARAHSIGLTRYIATPRVAKHRLFVWLDAGTLPDSRSIVFARDDDYTFGVLHSRVHELWARGTGTQLREVESGFRYTPTTCFETFPFPRPDRRAAREGRGGRPPPRRAPRRLAQPARPRPRRAREAHPHQPLQPAPHLARPRPRRPRRRRPRRLRLAPNAGR